MNRKSSYKDLDKWRTTTNAQRKKNYQRGNFSDGTRRRYTLAEIDKILAHDVPDRELARELKRSVQAIQIMRSRCTKREAIPPLFFIDGV